MNNQDFVQSLNLPQATQQKMLDAMEKYAENHWWEPDVDPRKYAYYQLHEPLWLSSEKTLRHFHESVQLLVDRPVLPWEYLDDALKHEAARAWTYQVGCTSDAERNERILDAVRKAHEDYGIPIISRDEEGQEHDY